MWHGGTGAAGAWLGQAEGRGGYDAQEQLRELYRGASGGG